MSMTMARLLSVSGGKDSTAMYLLALERGKTFRAIFADTGFEARATYDYVAALPWRTGGPPIETVKADLSDKFPKRRDGVQESWALRGVPQKEIDEALAVLHPTGNPFLDTCLLRGGFPSHYRRFCTDHLKLRPICKQVYEPLLDEGKVIISWNGSRRDESVARRLAPIHERRELHGCDHFVFRPLSNWKVSDVMRQHARHGLTPNPLYAQGFNRVGCFPCILSSKREVRTWADADAEAVERVAEWERIVAKSSPSHSATFFQAKDLAGKLGRNFHHTTHGIHAKVAWSRTSKHDERQLPMFAPSGTEPQEAWSEQCSTYGVCE